MEGLRLKVSNLTVGNLSGSINGLTFYHRGTTQFARTRKQSGVPATNPFSGVAFTSKKAAFFWSVMAPERKAQWKNAATLKGYSNAFLFFRRCFVLYQGACTCVSRPTTQFVSPPTAMLDPKSWIDTPDFTPIDWQFVDQGYSYINLSFTVDIARVKNYGEDYGRVVLTVKNISGTENWSTIRNSAYHMALVLEVNICTQAKSYKGVLYGIPDATFYGAATTIHNASFQTYNGWFPLDASTFANLYTSSYKLWLFPLAQVWDAKVVASGIIPPHTISS